MKSYSVAFLIYGDIHSTRNALTEEKYQDLANAFLSAEFSVESVLYNDESVDVLRGTLQQFDAILVWVNPIEQGKDRRKLDALLTELSAKGVFVSTHPEVILKMGTKQVLYATQELGWGSSTKLYTSYEDFISRFPESVQQSGVTILKQYRGNGGNGVFKVSKISAGNQVRIIPAKNSHEAKTLSWDDFFTACKPYFTNKGMLIEQACNTHLANGMVRCYVSGTRVAGFGYQEINLLYQLPGDDSETCLPPSKRYYFTQHCGLFSDLKHIMETDWIAQLQKSQNIANEMMPVIWDADFFINQANRDSAIGKYTLCEINVSCVSPFPPSAITFIVDEVRNRLRQRKQAQPSLFT